MTPGAFRLTLSLERHGRIREAYAKILEWNGRNVPARQEEWIVGNIVDLWRDNQQICAMLLLDAHDAWSTLAAQRRNMAFALEIERHADGLRPLRILADKTAIPLLALDLAISRRIVDNVYNLDELLGFSGRWAISRLEQFPDECALRLR